MSKVPNLRVWRRLCQATTCVAARVTAKRAARCGAAAASPCCDLYARRCAPFTASALSLKAAPHPPVSSYRALLLPAATAPPVSSSSSATLHIRRRKVCSATASACSSRDVAAAHSTAYSRHAIIITTTDTLRSYFIRWGDVSEVVLVKDHGTQKSKGCAFVRYRTRAGYDAALEAAGDMQLEGRKVRIEHSMRCCGHAMRSRSPSRAPCNIPYTFLSARAAGGSICSGACAVERRRQR